MVQVDLQADLRALVEARDAAATKPERRALSQRVKLLRAVISARRDWGWPLVFEEKRGPAEARPKVLPDGGRG